MCGKRGCRAEPNNSVLTGKKLLTLTHPRGSVDSVAFDPDGRRIATAACGATRLWRAANGQLIGMLVSLKSGNEWLIATAEGYYDGSRGAAKLVKWGFQDDALPLEAYRKEYYRPERVASAFQDGNRIE